MARHLYIYYRVAEGRAELVRERVSGLQSELYARTGIRGRLLHRQDDPALWMETYESLPDAYDFEGTLDTLVKAHRIDALLAPGARRVVECFVD